MPKLRIYHTFICKASTLRTGKYGHDHFAPPNGDGIDIEWWLITTNINDVQSYPWFYSVLLWMQMCHQFAVYGPLQVQNHKLIIHRKELKKITRKLKYDKTEKYRTYFQWQRGSRFLLLVKVFQFNM